MDWKIFADNLRQQATELQRLVATQPAEQGRAIGSAGIVLASLANAVDAARGEVRHASDCAVHNAPALPVGPCNCGAVKSAA